MDKYSLKLLRQLKRREMNDSEILSIWGNNIGRQCLRYLSKGNLISIAPKPPSIPGNMPDLSNWAITVEGIGWLDGDRQNNRKHLISRIISIVAIIIAAISLVAQLLK